MIEQQVPNDNVLEQKIFLADEEKQHKKAAPQVEKRPSFYLL